MLCFSYTYYIQENRIGPHPLYWSIRNWVVGCYFSLQYTYYRLLLSLKHVGRYIRGRGKGRTQRYVFPHTGEFPFTRDSLFVVDREEQRIAYLSGCLLKEQLFFGLQCFKSHEIFISDKMKCVIHTIYTITNLTKRLLTAFYVPYSTILKITHKFVRFLERELCGQLYRVISS